VNEKIEGFFETCRRRGLTGAQGVILPKQNVVHLMLRESVRQAVRDGEFHIYPVGTIDEGIEILTGVPAGERMDDGAFPPDSVHGRVEARLREITANLKAKAEDEEEAEAGPNGEEADAPEESQDS
jgi:predicted ATP-dependent protease